MNHRIVEIIKDDFVNCKIDWDLYAYLFMKSTARVNSLNNIAGRFFAVIQWSLIETTIIRISRLTDKCVQGRNSNLTLELFKNYGMERKIFGIEEKYETLINSTEIIRNYRNKRFAHRDFEIAHEHKPSTKIGDLKINQITQAINLIEAFINDFCNVFGFEELHYPTPIDIEGILSFV